MSRRFVLSICSLVVTYTIVVQTAYSGIDQSAKMAVCVSRLALVALETVRYVTPTGMGTGTGNWSNASGDLQGMITASSAGTNDEVWVKAGTYKPGSSRSSTFSLKSGIGVYGGFAGSEEERGERDFEA